MYMYIYIYIYIYIYVYTEVSAHHGETASPVRACAFDAMSKLLLSGGRGLSTPEARQPSETYIRPFTFPAKWNPILKHRASCVTLAGKH